MLHATPTDAEPDTALVHFKDGAVSFWHTHPGGQQLFVVRGNARVGTEADGETSLATGHAGGLPAERTSLAWGRAGQRHNVAGRHLGDHAVGDSRARMTHDHDLYDVAIVGLGPTGATLANLCGLYGLRTVVYERSTAPYSQPRACHLDAEIARVLQQCGFELQLHELLTESAGMEYVDRDGRRLFNFEDFHREPLLGWHEDYVFLQPELEAMLRAGLAQYEHVDVRLGSEVADPLALLDDATYVVACDGGGGRTREQLGIGARSISATTSSGWWST